MSNAQEKPVFWMSSTRKDLLSFPQDVIRDIGHSLGVAQLGGKADNARVMAGFGGASVVEIRENFDTNTYRAVYTVRFNEGIYVLHCFMKKSSSGIATPRPDLDLIATRLQAAQALHEKYVEKMSKGENDA